MPRAKIVGNMIDMKGGNSGTRRLPITKIQLEEDQISVARTFAVGYRVVSPSIRCAGYFFNKIAPVNRPTRKKTKPSDARFEAPLLLMTSEAVSGPAQTIPRASRVEIRHSQRRMS